MYPALGILGGLGMPELMVILIVFGMMLLPGIFYLLTLQRALDRCAVEPRGTRTGEGDRPRDEYPGCNQYHPGDRHCHRARGRSLLDRLLGEDLRVRETAAADAALERTARPAAKLDNIVVQ
jgi:hypothetical protein